MSIEKPQQKTISSRLQELIDVANNSITTIKSQILEIYETAKLEGFTPLEARALIEVKVVKFSDRYLRKLLPDEAKDTDKVNKSLNSNAEHVPHGIDTEDFEDEDEKDENSITDNVNFAEHVPQIPAPKTEIKDAETVSEEEHLHDLPEPEYSAQDLETKSSEDTIEIQNLTNKVRHLELENTKLRMEKVGTIGNKFVFEYDLEITDEVLEYIQKHRILPLIITAFPDKKDGYPRADKARMTHKK